MHAGLTIEIRDGLGELDFQAYYSAPFPLTD